MMKHLRVVFLESLRLSEARDGVETVPTLREKAELIWA